VHKFQQVQAGGAAGRLDKPAGSGGKVEHLELLIHDGIRGGVAFDQALRAADEHVLPRTSVARRGWPTLGVGYRDGEVNGEPRPGIDLLEDAEPAVDRGEELRVLRDVLGVAQ